MGRLRDTYEDRQVVQIMPPGGWRAVYADTESGDPMDAPLICWAVVRMGERSCHTRRWSEPPEQIVEGLEAGPDGTHYCEEADNFLGYLAPDGDIHSFDEEAAKHARKGGAA